MSQFNLNSPGNFAKDSQGLADSQQSSAQNAARAQEGAEQLASQTKGSFGVQGHNTHVANGEGYQATGQMHGKHAEGSSEFLRDSMNAHQSATDEQTGVSKASTATAEGIYARVNK